jgi:hypothetical protein
MTYLYCPHCGDKTEHYISGVLKDNDIIFTCTECMYGYRYHRTTVYSMPVEEK